jgi:hypothetical protein
MLQEYMEERRPRWAARELVLDLNVESPTVDGLGHLELQRRRRRKELFPSPHPDVAAASPASNRSPPPAVAVPWARRGRSRGAYCCSSGRGHCAFVARRRGSGRAWDWWEVEERESFLQPLT